MYTLEGYAGLAEVALHLFASTHSHADDDAHRSRVRRACRALQAFARVMPVAKPRALLMQGKYCAQVGSRSKAVRLWRKSLEAAEHLQMPYEQALAHFELATNAGSSESEREKHLAVSRALFTTCHAFWPQMNADQRR